MIPIPNGHVILPNSVQELGLVVNASQLLFEKGLAKAVTDDEIASMPFYGGLRALEGEARFSRKFDAAIRNRLDWAVEHKEINKGKFDDRKLRFHSHVKFFEANHQAGSGEIGPDQAGSPHASLILSFGPSHFEEHIATNVRSIHDSAFHGRLSERGARDFNDPFAYFANNVALNVIVLTSDDKYLLGKRAESAQLFPGYWHNVGGFADAVNVLNLFNRQDGSSAVRSAFQTAMKDELLEEVSIEAEMVQGLREIAVTYGISSVDINYDARVLADSEYIRTKGHFKGKDKEEHSGFVGVAFEDLVDVLAGKKLFDLKSPAGVIDRPEKTPASNIVPVGRGGMMVHVGLRDPAALDYILKQPMYQYSF